MKTCSILVSFPGYPFSIKTLLPNHHLAAIAGCLRDADHITEIRDLGTIETLDYFFPRKLRVEARLLADRFLDDPSSSSLSMLSTFWRLRGADRALHSRQKKLCAEVAREIAAVESLNFVVFGLNREEELEGAVAIAQQLRETAPGVRLVAAGAFVESYGEALAQVTDAFDCYCLAEAEWTLVQWAEQSDRPDTWYSIPNLAYSAPGYVYSTERRSGPDLDGLPYPAYDTGTYPALAGRNKLKLFSLDDSRGYSNLRSQISDLRSQISNLKSQIRVKSPAALCDEMEHLGKLHGVRAFHFASPSPPATQLYAVAYEILSRGLNVRYSRWGSITGVTANGFPALKSSGCEALSFRVDSGSQWLLEDYYGHDFGVTQIERVLRACKFSSIFTLPHFTYPCPSDDYHTQAETLRLIQRTQPHGVCVEAPERRPLSEQKGHTDAFGADKDVKRYLRRLIRGRGRTVLPSRVSRALPFYTRERSSAQVGLEYEELIGAIIELGVPTTVSADLALVARLSGYEGREEDFAALVRRQLLTGDTDGIAAVAGHFNDSARVPSNLVAFRPFTQMLEAVGN